MESVLSAQVELMEEYKKGEHANWDLDKEIQEEERGRARYG